MFKFANRSQEKRTHVASVQGNDAFEMEDAAMDEAGNVWGPATPRRVVRTYKSQRNTSFQPEKEFIAVITIQEI